MGAIMENSFRIPVLMWADILIRCALFVMQIYLTDVWKLSFTHAAGILNIWGGISMILPVFFRFLVDQFLGHFKMLLVSSVAYTLGISFITMSTPPVLANSTHTCEQYEPQCIGHTQKVLFYTGMALMAVGTAGNLVSLRPFWFEQDKSEVNAEMNGLFKVRGLLFACLATIIGAIAVSYAKPWSLRFGIPAICSAFATLHFVSGSLEYYKVDPPGSPLTTVCRVFVAFVSKKSRTLPLDSNLLYTKNDEKPTHTRFLRCLEKAAIILPDTALEDQVKNRWRLCSVAEVEEAKIFVRMVPMWLTFIVCGIVSSMGNTYFVEQTKHLKLKYRGMKFPLQVFMLYYVCARLFLLGWAKGLVGGLEENGPQGRLHRRLYRWLHCLLHCFRQVYEDSELEGHEPLQGTAMAMTFSILCCITAAKIEKRRINVIRSHGLLDKPDDDIPMTAAWLLAQFFLLAGLDTFLQTSVAALYKNQAPESMRKYLKFFTKGACGLGFMCGVVSVHAVGKVSKIGGRRGWFQHTLNRSRLDRYYWVLAVLSSVNILVFYLMACIYMMKDSWKARQGEEHDEVE